MSIITDTPEPERRTSPARPVAACADGTGRLTRLFFSDELEDIARAKRICATCPLMAECLEGALTRRERWGVWGGQLFVGGRVVMAKRRRGRPPRQPRPGDQLPEVPIPAHLEPLLTA
jgi:WhiB family redox-sensing transcriptional regulator